MDHSFHGRCVAFLIRQGECLWRAVFKWCISCLWQCFTPRHRMPHPEILSKGFLENISQLVSQTTELFIPDPGIRETAWGRCIVHWCKNKFHHDSGNLGRIVIQRPTPCSYTASFHWAGETHSTLPPGLILAQDGRRCGAGRNGHACFPFSSSVLCLSASDT